MLITKLLQLSLKKIFTQFLNLVEALYDIFMTVKINLIAKSIKILLGDVRGLKYWFCL